MSQTQDPTDPLPSEVDDLDVEGHSMKDVALGLSAATIVASGAATTLGIDSPLGGTTSGARGIVAAADRTGSGAQDDVHSALTFTTNAAGATVATGIATVTPVGNLAVDVASDTVSSTMRIASNPVEETDRIADAAIADARNLRDAALQVSTDAAANATASAQQTAEQTRTAAESTAVTVAQSITTTATTVATQPVGASASSNDGSTTISATAAGITVEGNLG